MTTPNEPVEGGWQPIASAPKDGTVVLLYQIAGKTKSRYPLIIGRWVANWRSWQSVPGAWTATPTHWMPLPNPPVVNP